MGPHPVTWRGDARTVPGSPQVRLLLSFRAPTMPPSRFARRRLLCRRDHVCATTVASTTTSSLGTDDVSYLKRCTSRVRFWWAIAVGDVARASGLVRTLLLPLLEGTTSLRAGHCFLDLRELIFCSVPLAFCGSKVMFSRIGCLTVGASFSSRARASARLAPRVPRQRPARITPTRQSVAHQRNTCLNPPEGVPQPFRKFVFFLVVSTKPPDASHALELCEFDPARLIDARTPIAMCEQVSRKDCPRFFWFVLLKITRSTAFVPRG